MSEQYPHHDLSFTCSRRAFWRALLQEAVVVSGVLDGGQECRLSELGSLPDDQLAKLRPIVHPSCEIFVARDYVWIKYRETNEAITLFPVDQTENRVALGMFDGQHTLAEVGMRLAQALGWDPAKGFAHARDLFLSLAGRLICIPRDPLQPLE